MRKMQIVVLATAIATVAFAGGQTTVSVRELPPEPFPAGTCTESTSGYLGFVAKDKTERTKLSDKEIGQYVSKRLAEGYSVTLYPQASGKIFSIATCNLPAH